MSQYYRVQISSPSTKSKAAKTFTFTPESGVVQQIDVNLRKEGKRISGATVQIADPRSGGQYWPIFNSLPDPALSDVPIQIYLSKPGESGSASRLIFDGKVTSLQAGYPAVSHLTIVGHDRSIDLRLQAVYRTFRNKSGVQVAQAIAQQYGFAIDQSELANAVTTIRALEMGAGGVGFGALSDWHHITRALAVDGIELYTKGKTIAVRKSAQKQYPTTFRPDDGIVVQFDANIQHVFSPGASGQAKVPVPGGNAGTNLSVIGTDKRLTDAQKADARMHRTTPQGAAANAQGAHTESTGNYVGPADLLKKRKDEATLTIRATPDIGHQHLINILGWGAKVDGLWNIMTIKHAIAGAGPALTVLNLHRGPSSADRKQVGVLPAGNTSAGP